MKQLTEKELEQIVGGVSQTYNTSEDVNLNENRTCVCDYTDHVVGVTNENTVDSCKCRCCTSPPVESTPTPTALVMNMVLS